MELKKIPVHLSSIRPLMCSKSLRVTCGSLPQGEGHSLDNLYWWYTHNGTVRATCNTSPARSLGNLGIPEKLPQTCTTPNANHQLPGIYGELQRDEALPTMREDGNNLQGSNKNSEFSTACAWPRIGKNDRVAHCNNSCSSTSPSTLPQSVIHEELSGLTRRQVPWQSKLE